MSFGVFFFQIYERVMARARTKGRFLMLYLRTHELLQVTWGCKGMALAYESTRLYQFVVQLDITSSIHQYRSRILTNIHITCRIRTHPRCLYLRGLRPPTTIITPLTVLLSPLLLRHLICRDLTNLLLLVCTFFQVHSALNRCFRHGRFHRLKPRE